MHISGQPDELHPEPAATWTVHHHIRRVKERSASGDTLCVHTLLFHMQKSANLLHKPWCLLAFGANLQYKKT